MSEIISHSAKNIYTKYTLYIPKRGYDDFCQKTFVSQHQKFRTFVYVCPTQSHSINIKIFQKKIILSHSSKNFVRDPLELVCLSRLMRRTCRVARYIKMSIPPWYKDPKDFGHKLDRFDLSYVLLRKTKRKVTVIVRLFTKVKRRLKRAIKLV